VRVVRRFVRGRRRRGDRHLRGTRRHLSAGDTRPGDDTRTGDDTRGADTTGADVSGVDVGGDGTSGDTGTDASLGPYPSGPYGKNAGDVIANLQWVGYENDAADALVSTKPYGSYSMDAARLSGRRYALLHVSEFY
jgi:hypothetical protein